MAHSVGLSVGAVGGTLHRARAAGLTTWAAVEAVTRRSVPGGPAVPAARRRRPAAAPPGLRAIHTERRQPGVTLELLHLEYLERHPDGYHYTQFCELYRHWLRRRGLTMRQVHRAARRASSTTRGSGRASTIRDGRADRRALRDGARRVELHLRRGDAHAAAPRLDREPHARLRLLRRRAAAVVRDQLKSGVTGAVSLRARRAAPLRRARHALRDHDPAGPPGEAARQSQGRGRRAGRRALDRRAAAPRDLFHAGGAQRADRRAPGRAERETDAPLRRREPGRRSSTASISRRCARCRPASSTPSGSRRGSISTTTSPSSTTRTPCRTRSSTKPSRCG